MNDADHPLARLLRAAATSQRRGEAELPAGFITRVLATWRAGDDDATGRWFVHARWPAPACCSIFRLWKALRNFMRGMRRKCA